MFHGWRLPSRTAARRYLPVRAFARATRDPVLVRRNDSERGQTLVEFALVFPIFILLIVCLIEFSLAFNALLSVNFASRDAALLAAEAGEDAGSDCVILHSIDEDVQPPASRVRISTVRIYWADSQGNEIDSQVYQRNATPFITCNVAGIPATLPYSLQTGGYPENERCSVLAGCPEDPGHTELDNIGVAITYSYTWVTPMAKIITFGGPGFTLTHANVMRMEPVL
jgi:hypothetical protein